MTTSAANSLLTLDVREILKKGGEPFSEIMQAVASLAPGQGLRLLATFKPAPLFGVMAQQGYSHTEREIGGGDWEVVFTPGAAGAGSDPARAANAPAPVAGAQPHAATFVDVRGLTPPEPMQRALEAVEALKAGESLEVLTDREPTLLFQELARRHHSYESESCREGYRTKIRRSDAAGERA